MQLNRFILFAIGITVCVSNKKNNSININIAAVKQINTIKEFKEDPEKLYLLYIHSINSVAKCMFFGLIFFEVDPWMHPFIRSSGDSIQSKCK